MSNRNFRGVPSGAPLPERFPFEDRNHLPVQGAGERFRPPNASAPRDPRGSLSRLVRPNPVKADRELRRSQVRGIPREQTRGPGNHQIGGSGTGGSIVGGSGAGGSLVKGQIQGLNHKDMYHNLLQMSPHVWEGVREHANQVLGGQKSHMWSNSSDIQPMAAKRHYQQILRASGPHMAAKMVEHEHSARGAGMLQALKHTMHQGLQLAGQHAGAINAVLGIE